MSKRMNNKGRPQIEQTIRVKVLRSGKDRYKAKTLPVGTLTEHDIARLTGVHPGQLAHVLNCIVGQVRAGYDVKLFECLRFFSCMKKDMKLRLIAQTMGKYRHSLDGVKVRTVRYDPKLRECDVPTEEAKGIIDAACETRNKMVCVTPDMVIECPNCGTSIRVGKVLKSEK